MDFDQPPQAPKPSETIKPASGVVVQVAIPENIRKKPTRANEIVNDVVVSAVPERHKVM